MKAKRLLFLVLAICLTNGMKAQFYDNYVHYYVEAGKRLDDCPKSYAVLFDGQKMALIYCSCASNIKNKLRQDANYYDNELSRIISKELTTLQQLYDNQNLYTYNSSKSNTKNVLYELQIYTKEFPTWNGITAYGMPPKSIKKLRFDYCIFSENHESMIFANEDKNGVIFKKTYYIEIDKSELMPKASTYDFFE